MKYAYTKQEGAKQTVNTNIGGKRGSARYSQVVEKPKNGFKTLKKLFKYFKSTKGILIGLLIVVVICAAVSLFAPSFISEAIDAITERNWSDLRLYLFLLLGFYVFEGIFTLIKSLLSAKLSQLIVKRMRADLFRKVNNLPLKYLDNHSNGDIMSRMTNDIENISSTLSSSLSSLISGILTIIGTIAFMFYFSWQLTLISMSTIVLTVVISKILTTVMRKLYKKKSITQGYMNGLSEEMITGYKSVAAYTKEKDVINEFDELSDDLKSTSLKAEMLGGAMGPVMNFISNISYVIVAAFGGYFALNGIITIGMITAFIMYSKKFTRPVNEIAQLYGSIQTAIAGAERVFEIMDLDDENKDGSLEIDDCFDGIEFKDVCFSYVPGVEVIHKFNLKVAPGEKVALVGGTGSGKTTVVNLLLRFYDLDSGTILVDEKDISQMNRDKLRKNVSIVLQDTVLFSDTIEHNIKYSNLDAPDELMYKAAEMSNSSFYIDQLPEKYHTVLTQSGEALSQGQRQLLAIARAVLADPKILILDEATSNVDTLTEKKIQDAMLNLMKNRTSLIIAHRLSTIKDADKIVVMDKGSIVEVGNHEDLLAKKGTYYNLYMTQFAGNQI